MIDYLSCGWLSNAAVTLSDVKLILVYCAALKRKIWEIFFVGHGEKTKRDQDLRRFLMSIPGGMKKRTPQ